VKRANYKEHGSSVSYEGWKDGFEFLRGKRFSSNS